MNKKEIKKRVKEFLKGNEKKITIEVPKDFKMSWISSPLTTNIRKVGLAILSKVPPMGIKNFMFKLLGYNFGKDVCLPGYIYIDTYFPKLIRLDEGILVGGMVTIKPWELKDNKLTLGRIHLKRRILLSGWAKIMPGVTVEKNVLAGMKAVITKDIPKNSFVIKENKILKTWSKEEAEKYFGESKKHKSFAREIKNLTDSFRKNKELRTIKFRNNGKRLNAGNEWWRARPVWRIYYNGIFVESSLLCPFEWVRKLLFKMMGVKLGKNLKLGKKVIFDHIYGDMVTVKDNVTIEDNVFLDGHEYTITETVYGKTVIEDGAHLKKGCYIREGLTIGKNAIIEENSVVMKDVKEGEIWAGSPAKKIK